MWAVDTTVVSKYTSQISMIITFTGLLSPFYRLGMSLNTTFYGINNGIFVMNLTRLRSREDLYRKKLLVWVIGVSLNQGTHISVPHCGP